MKTLYVILATVLVILAMGKLETAEADELSAYPAPVDGGAYPAPVVTVTPAPVNPIFEIFVWQVSQAKKQAEAKAAEVSSLSVSKRIQVRGWGCAHEIVSNNYQVKHWVCR